MKYKKTYIIKTVFDKCICECKRFSYEITILYEAYVSHLCLFMSSNRVCMLFFNELSLFDLTCSHLHSFV